MRRLVLILFVILAFSCKKDEKPAATGTSPQTRGGSGSVQTTSGSETAAPSTATTPPATESTDVGATMPEYSATGLDGSKYELANARGKVVLLNLWATWCGPCRYEIPELEMLHGKYNARGFEVVGVSVDESGPESVKEFVSEQKMTYPIVLDPEGKLASIFQTSVLPTSVVIDRKGTIVWKKYGAILPNDAELVAAIEKAL